MYEISKIIKEIKQGDTEKIIYVIEKMKPVINKYKKILYKDEKEDIEGEMVLALWEAICKMEYFDDDGKCVIYLKNAIHNKFLELYRNSRKKFDHEISDSSEINNEIIFNEKYDEINFMIDIFTYIKYYKDRKYRLAIDILINNKTDKDISNELKISRQYINKIRKNIYQDLKKYFNIKKY